MDAERDERRDRERRFCGQHVDRRIVGDAAAGRARVRGVLRG